MKFYEFGRSMVEMLGVLAIIGVLSVGAISGYSKAMMKYKLNKQAEQLNQLAAAVEANYHLIDAGSDQRITKLYEKLGYVPKEMIKDDSDYIYDVFNNKIFISYSNSNESWLGAGKYVHGLHIFANFLDDDIAKQTCVNMLTLIKEYRQSMWYVELLPTDDAGNIAGSTVFAKFYGETVSNTPKINGITVSDMMEFCTSAVADHEGTNIALRAWWRT